MTHTETNPDRRPHADQRIHGFKWRQDAQRITADVARHVAVKVLERDKYRAVRASRAQFGRLAGNRLRLGRKIALHDAAHPRDVQFPEAVHLRLALDGDAGHPSAFH